MKTYINIANPKQKPVLCNSAGEAAQIFATRTAKQVYGKNAYASLKLDGWIKDDVNGNDYNYQALLKTTRGRRPNEYEIGCNVYVYPRVK
jgi:hypothetical protein